MDKKPSERIAELWANRQHTTPLAFPSDELNSVLRAILDFLDEQEEYSLSQARNAGLKRAVEEIKNEIPQPEDWAEWTNDERRRYLQGARAVKNLLTKQNIIKEIGDMGEIKE